MNTLSARRARLQDLIAGQKLDGIIITALVNVRYLSGFTGSNAALVLSSGPPLLITDPRYEIQASEQSDCRVRVVKGPLPRAVGSAIRRKRLRRIGFENNRISYSVYDALREELPPGAELTGAGSPVDALRMVKSADEIELIRSSMLTCSKAYQKAMRKVRPGMTENALAVELEYQMRKLGADGPAFPTIVASGARSALPHAEPTAKAINNNELLLIDMGAQRLGYASDMTRMAHLGRPTRKTKQLYGAVFEAQLAALDAIRPGRTAQSVDRKARAVLESFGLDRFFTHSTGHGLGLEIHESPRIGKGEKTRLAAGMVITAEPGVYIAGGGGVRIEDTVVVTESGCEILTPVAKELLVI